MLTLIKCSMKHILTESMRNINKQFMYLDERNFRMLVVLISGTFTWLSEYGDTAADVFMCRKQNVMWLVADALWNILFSKLSCKNSA